MVYIDYLIIFSCFGQFKGATTLKKNKNLKECFAKLNIHIVNYLQ